jgi:hypothetical protein
MEEGKLLSKWKKAKRISERSKDFETSNKLNQFIKAKNTEEKLAILDDSINSLEKSNNINGDNKDIEEFRDILSSESFFKQDGKAQIISLESKKGNGGGLYEKLGISENDDMKNYQIFKMLTERTEEQETKKENKEGFHSIHEILKDAKYFEVPENINIMLCNTKNNISKVRLPYIYMFFDTKFIIEDRTYYGLLLGDISQLKEMAEKSKEIKHEDLASLGEDIIIQTFYEGQEGIGWVKLKMYEKTKDKKFKKLKEYIMNLIYFINSEDVKIMVNTRSEKNSNRRIQNGKIPLPSFNKINIVGYLAKYINKVESVGIGNNFTHRFWVRGHFRHFWNKKYDKLYQAYKNGKLKAVEGKQYIMDDTGALKLWIYPYIKGDGILIEKKYELK